MSLLFFPGVLESSFLHTTSSTPTLRPPHPHPPQMEIITLCTPPSLPLNCPIDSFQSSFWEMLLFGSQSFRISQYSTKLSVPDKVRISAQTGHVLSCFLLCSEGPSTGHRTAADSSVEALLHMYCVEKPSSKVWLGQRQCPSRNHLPCTACFSTHIPKRYPTRNKNQGSRK